MIQRPEYLKQMKAFLKTFWDFDVSKPKATQAVGEASNNVLLLNGIPGCGKTSLVCSFISACENEPEYYCYFLHCGWWPKLQRWGGNAQALGEKLITLFGLSLNLHVKYRNILQWFFTILESAGRKAFYKKANTAIDGIDQLDSILQKTLWTDNGKSDSRMCIPNIIYSWWCKP